MSASLVSPHRFRHVLGHLPTGVTVITAFGAGGPVGMAANSVTSVSLDPPLILLCPARSSTTWPAIRAAGRFCVNVMAEHHEAVTRQFAAPGADRYAGVPHRAGEAGPALENALAWIDCRVREEHAGGDHTIVVADVLAVAATAADAPLVFFRGRYGRFVGA